MATSFYAIKNNAKSTITNNPLTAGGLSITLASSTGSKFPTTGNTWTACIWDDVTYPLNPTADPNMEVVLIDSRSTDTLTVNASGRGFGGTTGVSHATGSAIAITVSKEHISQITTAITTLEGASVGTFIDWTQWTPTLESGATDWNFSSKDCWYSRVGNIVHIQGYLSGTVTVGSASAALISLPIAAHATAPAIQTILYYWMNQSAVVFVRGFIAASDPNNIRAVGADDASAFTGNSVAAGHKIYFSGSYRAA